MSSTNDVSAHKKQARQRILEAAAHSFQTLGYARTTTQVIAAQANVAEVTIFRHFGNKQKLFQAVVQQISGAAGLNRIETQLTGDLRTDLLLIYRHALPVLIAQRTTIRMLMFESTHFPEIQEALAQNPHELCRMLSSYFQQQIEHGQMQSLNPETMAQVFTSMLFGYAIGLEPLNGLLSPEISLEEMIEQFVHIFVEGTAYRDNKTGK